ncbi:MAG: DUF4304 domain-containing protein [Oscillospiraceae bacterium]|nr:DUF4304 domain-containing protein [Oscillospiraceae bacterium]
MTTNDQRFKDLLSRLHTQVLKPAGFKKENSNFRIIQPNGTCKILNFQRSMWNDGTECKFCINVGLYFQKDPEHPNLRFKEYECQVRRRAGFMSERYREDHWWCLFEGRDMESLYADLKRTLTEDVLPWLDRFDTRQDVIRAGQSGTLNAHIWGSLYE